MLFSAWHRRNKVSMSASRYTWRHTGHERGNLLQITFFFTQDKVTEAPVYKSPKGRGITHDGSAVLCRRSGYWCIAAIWVVCFH